MNSGLLSELTDKELKQLLRDVAAAAEKYMPNWPTPDIPLRQLINEVIRRLSLRKRNNEVARFIENSEKFLEWLEGEIKKLGKT